MYRFVLSCFCFLFLSSANANADGSTTPAQLGKVLAKTHCSRCHVVDTQNPFTGISSTPSFRLLVNELEDWEERFKTFFGRLPHPSVVRFEGDAVDPDVDDLIVPVVIKPENVQALVAYARSLLDR